MSIGWVGLQQRSIDPYAPVDSDIISALTAAIASTGRGVCSGFDFSINVDDSKSLDVTKGVVIKDYVVIYFKNNFTMSMDVDTNAGVGESYIVLDYVFEKKLPAPYAKILVVPSIGGYDATRHIILGTITLDGALNITAVNFDNREWADLFSNKP